MPLNINFSGSGSGGSTSAPLVSIGGNTYSAGGSSSKPKTKRRNWWDKTTDAASGIATGLATTIGHAVYDPIAEVATGGEHESQIDDIGKLIVDDYRRRYSSWDEFKSDPFSAVLDVATVASAFFSLGGSLAVRGAGIGAKAGKAGTIAKAAGLEHSVELSNLAKTAGVESPEFLGALAKEELRNSAAMGRKSLTQRALSGERGRTKILKSGDVLVPQRGALRSIDGTILETVPYANSPYRRAMQKSGIALSNTERLNTKGIIGAQARAGKLHNRLNRISSESAAAAVLGAGGAKSVRKFSRKMGIDEEAAQYALNVGVSPRELSAFYGRQADELAGVSKKSARYKRSVHDTAKFGDEVLQVATNVNGAGVFAVDHALASKHATDQAAKLRAASSKAGTPAERERLREKASAWMLVRHRADNGTLEKYANKQQHLSRALRNPDEVIADLTRRQNIFSSQAVEDVFRSPTKTRLMRRVQKSQLRAAEYTTDFIKGDLNKNVSENRPYLLFEMAMGRLPTAKEAENIVVRPHARPAPKAQSVRDMRNRAARREGKPTEPKERPSTVPSFSKHSTGYNMAYAQDSMKPAAVFRAFNEARAYKAKMDIMAYAAKSGIKIDDNTAVAMGLDSAAELKQHLIATGEYELVGGNDKLIKMAHAVQEKLDNEVRLMVGPAMAREQASTQLAGLIAKYTEGAGEHAMPKAYYKYLTRDLRRADNFITRMIDAPTTVFRAAVLTLRPAWIANNFIGQMMLLLYSQGVMHGTREYMSEVNRTFGKGRIAGTEANVVREAIGSRAGSLTSGAGSMGAEVADISRAAEKATGIGWLVSHPGLRRAEKSDSLAAHTLSLAVRGIPSGVKGLSDLMGRMNAVLTDDIPRRAAFMGEVRPVLNQLKKHNPSLTTEDALALALKDDKTVARLVDKTMGDLIDFSRMNSAEKEIVRRALPFYSWMKGITLRTGRLIKEDPLKANISFQLGKQYSEGAPERFGTEVPGNLSGALVVGKNADGSPRIVTTAGSNIFQTPADIAGIIASPFSKGGFKFGATHPLSQLNPTLKAPIETMIGRDLFFGGPIYSDPSKGILNAGSGDNPYTKNVDESRAAWKGIGGRYLASLGPMALYTRVQKANEADAASTQGDTRLMQRSPADALKAYLGYPVSTLNRERAAEMARDAQRYAVVGYDPTLGETPGVYGRSRGGSKSTATKPPLVSIG